MRIFVGNIPFSAVEEDIRELFAPYGEVHSVQISTHKDTGRPRGFGFLVMPNDTEAELAIAGVHGRSLEGRPLTVNEAKPREESGGRPRPRW